MASKNTENKYQSFQQAFGEYQQLAESSKEAYSTSGDLSPALRDLTASLVDDSNWQNEMINEADTRGISNVLGKASEQRKIKAVDISKNLEGILNGAPEQDIQIGVNVIDPKSKYTGANASQYAKIATLQKKVRKMAEAPEQERTEKISEFYKEKYKGDDKADALELIEFYNNKVNPNFYQRVYANQIREETVKLGRELKGYEKGYLTENLRGKDFLEFYTRLQMAKRQIAEEQRRG